ncbi:MAG: N-acetylmuramoyl-L-alanine amidase [candidate division Zixibacteria bacterium]|nr:N-acetylmuramoyl-L-alanine amidase [candidate division Zixibacteria bacterium]
MHKIFLWLLILTIPVLSQNHLEIIYPKDSQQIAAVDSTFIFGNTNPKANLAINGFDIDIYKNGGFLAFLPVEKGEFAFDIISGLDSDVCITTINIQVGRLPDTSDSNIDRSTIKPSGRTLLMSDDAFELSFMAKTNGRIYCAFEHDETWTQMYRDTKAWRTASVFGEMESSTDDSSYALYTGCLPMMNINDSSRVYYLYEQDVIDSNGVTLWQDFETDSTDYYAVRLDDCPPRVISLVGRPHIVRTAPGKGYKLVNQTEGVRMLCTGELPDWYRVKLADNITGYVKKSDAVLEQEGASIPKGEVSFVVADDFPKYVRVAMKIGDQLPYEIHTDGNLMTVDIYGLNTDTDWIRLNDTGKYIKSIWWTQPQNGVYRLHIRWHDKHYWGYKGYYENDEFILKLKKKPSLKDIRICLDPGHSHDLGAVGPTGLKEKDANLWIAHELRQMLMRKGVEVLMTRMGHEHLEIYDRVDIASKWDADLLISIHNNALPDGINPYTHNGTSCYYYFNQARPLAEAIHKHLLKNAKLPDHGLYYGNLALCRVTECPAVLVECAFMMIPEQEAMLKTDKFQRKCAKAIYQGICDYLGE